MHPYRWGFEEFIVDRPEASARRIMVKEQFRTPLWQVSRDTSLVVGQGAVWLEQRAPDDLGRYGDPDAVMSGMWCQENDRIHLDKASQFRLTGVTDAIVYEYSYGCREVGDDDELKSLDHGRDVPDEDFRDLLLSYVRATTESGGVIDISEAGEVAEALARNGRLIGMCNGCFDMIHPGHAELLLQAKQRCEVLFVALNTDSSVRKSKGEGRPFISEDGRAIMLSSMKFVDHVVMNDSPTCVDAVKAIKPDIYVTTPDCVECAEAKAALAIGGRVEVVDPLPGWSTTRISNQILEAR